MQIQNTNVAHLFHISFLIVWHFCFLEFFFFILCFSCFATVEQVKEDQGEVQRPGWRGQGADAAAARGEDATTVCTVQRHPQHWHNNTLTAFVVQSAGSAKEEKDKGKKGKKGKGKEEPVKRAASQKPTQNPRNVEAAAKKPEETGGGEDMEVRRGEEGGPADPEEKVRDTSEGSNTFVL